MEFFNKLRKKLKGADKETYKKKIRKTLGQKEPYTRPGESGEGSLSQKERMEKMVAEANEAAKKLRKDKDYQKKLKSKFK